MVTIRVLGWGLGLEGLSTVGADVQVGVWPAQQQAGQDTPQRYLAVEVQFLRHSSVTAKVPQYWQNSVTEVGCH